MDSDELMTGCESSGIFRNPIPCLLTGLALMFAAMVLGFFTSGMLVVVPLALGALAAGIAVAIAPRAWWVLAGASGAALLGVYIASMCHWDFSIKVLFWWAAVIAALAALLMGVFNTFWRRVVISFIIVFHFGGMMTAITSAPPQSWLSAYLWLKVYRPYLQFLYLNNAYHFYSPEPGPAHLLFYFIEYEPNEDSRNYRWVRVPFIRDGQMEEYDEMGQPRRFPYVEFTRRLSLAETAGQTSSPPAGSAAFQELLIARTQAGTIDNYPFQDIVPPAMQYREPQSMSKKWLSSYARHVARTYKCDLHPEKQVKSVKIYLVTHELIRPQEFGKATDEDGRVIEGRKLNDPTLYVPTFMGEFDRDGKMLPECYEFDINEFGQRYVVRRSPYLYWVLPILYHDRGPGGSVSPGVLHKDSNVDNYMRKHAGDPNWENQPWEDQP
jgi:hypothetical protein